MHVVVVGEALVLRGSDVGVGLDGVPEVGGQLLAEVDDRRPDAVQCLQHQRGAAAKSEVSLSSLTWSAMPAPRPPGAVKAAWVSVLPSLATRRNGVRRPRSLRSSSTDASVRRSAKPLVSAADLSSGSRPQVSRANVSMSPTRRASAGWSGGVGTAGRRGLRTRRRHAAVASGAAVGPAVGAAVGATVGTAVSRPRQHRRRHAGRALGTAVGAARRHRRQRHRRRPRRARRECPRHRRLRVPRSRTDSCRLLRRRGLRAPWTGADRHRGPCIAPAVGRSHPRKDAGERLQLVRLVR